MLMASKWEHNQNHSLGNFSSNIMMNLLARQQQPVTCMACFKPDASSRKCLHATMRRFSCPTSSCSYSFTGFLKRAGLLEEMEGSSCVLGCKNSTYIGRQTASHSLLQSEISQCSSKSSLVGLKGNERSQEVSGHQALRWASDFFIEEQPYWLEELLNEPDTRVHRNHRRSASDTFAYLGEAVEGLDIREGTNQKDVTSASLVRKDSIHYNDSSQIKFEIRTSSQDEKFKKDSNVAISRFAEKLEKDEFGSQNPEGSVEGTSNSSPPKHPASKTDAKRAKQQSAHRSRIRKLQYISQLERTIQLLQAEGSDISAELEFLDRQNLILSMENKALKQRLDSLTQEQLIKQMEQEMLKRELGRLQNLYQLQRQKQIQMHQQQPKMKQKQ